MLCERHARRPQLLDLLDADYTFVNERLARHYGIPTCAAATCVAFRSRRQPRRGLLGQGSILTVTSVANRTSPVMRGAWVMENLLGAPVPRPPPGVEADLEAMRRVHAQPATLRERLEQHRDKTVRGLPPDHGSHRLLAGELRSRRPLA